MQKQKIYKEIYGDILREKNKLSTQSWNEKKSRIKKKEENKKVSTQNNEEKD